MAPPAPSKDFLLCHNNRSFNLLNMLKFWGCIGYIKAPLSTVSSRLVTALLISLAKYKFAFAWSMG
jgi:hypothetical protein